MSARDTSPRAAAGSADAPAHFRCDVCYEDKSVFVALGCHFKLKPGKKIVCRGYVCKECSAGFKSLSCPWCNEECLPVDKRPIINIID